MLCGSNTVVLTNTTSLWQRRVLFDEIAISPSEQNNCDIRRLLARAADFFVKRGAISRNLDIFAGTALFLLKSRFIVKRGPLTNCVLGIVPLNLRSFQKLILLSLEHSFVLGFSLETKIIIFY